MAAEASVPAPTDVVLAAEAPVPVDIALDAIAPEGFAWLAAVPP